MKGWDIEDNVIYGPDWFLDQANKIKRDLNTKKSLRELLSTGIDPRVAPVEGYYDMLRPQAVIDYLDSLPKRTLH